MVEVVWIWGWEARIRVENITAKVSGSKLFIKFSSSMCQLNSSLKNPTNPQQKVVGFLGKCFLIDF